MSKLENPERPRPVLRIGFAGHRKIAPESRSMLDERIEEVLRILGHRLAALCSGVSAEAGGEIPVASFFNTDGPPLMRLVTGLCEGADDAAAQALERYRIACEGSGQAVNYPKCELAAVLPFGVVEYRKSRWTSFLPEFDRQAERCAYILALDGYSDRVPPTSSDKAREQLAKRRRAKAYRAQSKFLLRHADLLLAVADPGAQGADGGTRETLRSAQAFGLPIIFIHSETGAVRRINPENDLDDVLAEEAPNGPVLEAEINELVSRLIADPDLHVNCGKAERGEDLLSEYFADKGSKESWQPNRSIGQATLKF